MLDEEKKMLFRLHKLESRVRTLIWVASFLVLAVFAATGEFLYRRLPRTVEVTQLIVRDSSGAVLATLGKTAHGACLDLTGGRNSSASLCVDGIYGAALGLNNKNPRSSASLSAGNKMYEGGGNMLPGLFIEGPDGKNKFYVNVGSMTEFVLGENEEKSSVVLSATPDPKVQIFDQHRRIIWSTAH